MAAKICGSLPNRPRWASSTFKSPKQNDVVFVAAIVADDTKSVGQGIEFAGHFVGIGMDVDQREGEGLIGWRPADTKPADQRLAVQHVVGIGHGVEGRAVGLDAGGVEDVGVLFFAVGAAQPWTDEIVVMAAGGVDQVDEAGQDIVGLGPHFLDRHDVELADDVGQDVHHAPACRASRLRRPEC